MAKWPTTRHGYPVSPKAYPTTPKAYPSASTIDSFPTGIPPEPTGTLQAVAQSATTSLQGTVLVSGDLAAVAQSASTSLQGTVTGGTFSPLDIAGCVLWFDMQDAGSYTQAGTVTSITNKASSVAWTEAVVPPPYDATALNGHPCMAPAGAQWILSTEAAVLAAFTDTAPRTVAWVGSFAVADSIMTVFASGRSDGTTATTRVGTNTTGAGRWVHVTRNNAGTTITSDSAGGSDTNNHVFIWTKSTTTTSLQVDNGAADPSGAAHNPGASTPTRLGLFVRPNSGLDTPMTGVLGELVVYDDEVIGTDITDLFTYLDTKWL